MIGTKEIVSAIPDGILLGSEDIYISTYRKNDTPAHRVRFDVCGHDVQIIITKGDKSAVVVFVDEHCQQMPLSSVGMYVAKYVR